MQPGPIRSVTQDSLTALPYGLAVLRALPLPRKLGLLERIYGHALRKHGVCWVRTASGVVWKLDLRDSSQRWIVFGDYEGEVQMNWIRHWLQPGGTVVDSGANIGQLLLYLATLPGVEIHAFEPIPGCAQWLRECLDRQPDWPVDVVEAALSDSPGTIRLQAAGPHSTARMDWYQDKHYPRIDVSKLRLDDYARSRNIQHIRLWKLDVEGGEVQALSGAQLLLTQQRIDAVLVETSAETADDIHRLVSGHGYRSMRIGARQSLVADSATVNTLTNRIYIRSELESR